jgi:EAL and modified HD-GYP domain-containing signal transduction protein
MRFIGRQPILNTEDRVYGYEMLFRSGPENVFSGDAEDASRDVIDHCLMLLSEAGSELLFLNCTRHVLMTGMVTLLPPANTVLEILEDVDPDPELMEACVRLREKGYRFALDDFDPEESKRPFLDIVDFIKIDFLASDAAKRQAIYAMADGKDITFIAEKVESASDVQQARDEGCKLFQGYFFSRPVVLRTRAIPQNQAIYLRLLAALARTPTDVCEVERLVLSDPSLCYRLLRLVNSALYALPAPIYSIRSALLMVGDKEFRKAVTVALAGLAGETQSRLVVEMALERARFCELLAPLMNESSSRLYLLGMLSLIDVILAVPMRQIMSSLPVDAEMKAALSGEKNSLSLALHLVRCHESGDWREYEAIRNELNLLGDTSTIYIEALKWANQSSKGVSQ